MPLLLLNSLNVRWNRAIVKRAQDQSITDFATFQSNVGFFLKVKAKRYYYEVLSQIL